METFVDFLETILKYIVEICTIGLETAGIIVLVSSAVICFYKWLRRDREHIRLDLAQGIALALEFKMGGEVLRTVVVREWAELVILGAIIILRAALTFLIHWEIEKEKKELKSAQDFRALNHSKGYKGKRKKNRKDSAVNNSEAGKNSSESGENEFKEVTSEEDFDRLSSEQQGH